MKRRDFLQMKEQPRPFTKRAMLFCLLAVPFALATLRQAEADGKNTISFNRDIRPIFSDTCFRCHGPDKNARKAGLRLDIREEALRKTKSGITPIVPGNPAESEIVRRVFATEKYEVMPPPNAHKELSAQQKELIKRWVAEGAQYEGHWAYQPIKRLPVPSVSALAQAPVRNPIDAFIQARLAKEGLQPSPEADRRTLIRRVALDLTGIPPTPQAVAAFVNDKSPNAYERLVERLLNSDRYAEKQTLHWLDAVRYADTAGFHGDNAMPAWPYRDYVLRAFRDNKPFDEFTREQLAGDLLPNATNETRIASAYNRLNRVSAEGGLQPKEYLAKYAADRVRATSIIWLGATMGCAECHDHKFDPFASKDFYALKAFFADIKETGLAPDRGRDAWGSKLTLASAEQRRKFDELTRLINWTRSELDAQAQALSDKRAAWEAQTLADYQAGKLAWQFQRPLTAQARNGATLTIYNDQQLDVTQYRGGSVVSDQIKGDGLVVASGANPEREIYTVSFKPGVGEWTALGLEVAQDETLPANRIARGADRFVLTEVEAAATNGGPSQPLRFALATTDGAGQPVENPALAALDGKPETGWGVQYTDGRDYFLALRLAQKLKTTEATIITVRLRQEAPLRHATLGRFRLALSQAEHSWPDHQAHVIKVNQHSLRGLPIAVADALNTPADKRDTVAQKAILDHFKWAAPELQTTAIQLAQLEAARDLLDAQIPRALITEAISPMETRLLPRGNWMDDSGDVLQPAIPAVFGKLETMNRRATRLDLANWLVANENPLSARVFVNRVWRQFFGTGLSKTLEDLGSQGEWPVHSELLDWLASEFMHPVECGLRIADCGLKGAQHDWDIKHIIRLIVTSHTYRQTSNPQSAIRNPQSDDPDNRLLARQSRFRVEAETVRDIALSVSGLLVEQLGGPSVRPYQPEGYLGALNFPKRDYAADRGAALYRRGLYVHWQRTFLHPSLLAFDASSREECTLNRVNSNTPLQALVLLNDPIFVETARVFAQNALRQGGATPAQQIGWAFERALGRKPNAEEKQLLAGLYQRNLALYQHDAKAARELLQVGDAPLAPSVPSARLAALTTVTRALLNLHETITRN